MLDHTLKLDLDDDRHIIIGDIHGEYDCLMRTLDTINYDPAKDIIYTVGDMIDRGPKSYEVVEFFLQPRCYSIRGNHELMCIDSEWWGTWLSNGGMECLDSLERNKMSLEWLHNEIHKLPWVIEVGEDAEENAFTLVHAEMPYAWSDAYFRKILNEAINHDDPGFARLVWSRKMIDQAVRNVESMKPAPHEMIFHGERNRTYFCGHTPLKKPMRVGDTWFLDTRRSWSLTAIDAVTKQVWTVKNTGKNNF